MEPLESRIARLTPEQQQEVGDFVDFLLLKNNLRQAPAPLHSLIMVNTPPVMVPDPISQPVPHIQVPAPVPVSPTMTPVIHAEEESSSIHEITGGRDDPITRDYMDYGQFDNSQSPAAEVVKNVKQKIIAREEKEKEKGGHILDWVD